ncbi:MAG: NUDIX domain-containing protein [Candidatus Uhrbacteria bacterium]
MEPEIKVYIAGKVSKDSMFQTSFWREPFCRELSGLTGLAIKNLDPTVFEEGKQFDENNADLIFGRDCFMIKSADAVIVYLSDDISVGGSQEMLIAKYFKKPLIGLVPKQSKFFGHKELYGREYKNWTHPFVKLSCDYLVHDIEEAAICLLELFPDKKRTKDISFIEQAVSYYTKNYLPTDKLLHSPDILTSQSFAYKGLIIDPERERMLVIRYADRSDVAEKVRGRYGMAGGKIYNFDNPYRDFSRRVAEETGVKVAAKLPFGTWSWSHERDNQLHNIFAVAHLSLYQSGEIQDPYRNNESDLDRAYWLNFENVNIADFNEDEQPLLRSFFDYGQVNPFVV